MKVKTALLTATTWMLFVLCASFTADYALRHNPFRHAAPAAPTHLTVTTPDRQFARGAVLCAPAAVLTTFAEIGGRRFAAVCSDGRIALDTPRAGS